MLSKTTKLGLSLLVTAVFLAGCASTPDPEPETPAPDYTTPAATPDPTPTPDYSEPAPAPVQVVLGTTVYFDFNQSALRRETRTLLTAHADRLKANPVAILLEGYADERGTREYNMALGERRALAVRDFLRSEGVTSTIDVVSYGEERPVATGSNEAAWQANRRVEIVK